MPLIVTVAERLASPAGVMLRASCRPRALETDQSHRKRTCSRSPSRCAAQHAVQQVVEPSAVQQAVQRVKPSAACGRGGLLQVTQEPGGLWAQAALQWLALRPMR